MGKSPLEPTKAERKIREKRTRKMRRKPGYSWRYQMIRPNGERIEKYSLPAYDELGTNYLPERTEKTLRGPAFFDELVIDDWFHIESMDDRRWYLRIGDALMYVHVPRKGPVRLDVMRGDSGPIVGETHAGEQE